MHHWDKSDKNVTDEDQKLSHQHFCQPTFRIQEWIWGFLGMRDYSPKILYERIGRAHWFLPIQTEFSLFATIILL